MILFELSCLRCIILTMAASSHSRWAAPAFLFGCLGILLLGGTVLAATPAEVADSKKSVFLEYRELDNPIKNLGVQVENQTTPFAQEPALKGRKIIRGSLQFGAAPDFTSIRFLWEQDEGKLYLDLNGNQNLSDDPGGVFTCRSPNSTYQTFTNLHFDIKTGKTLHPIAMDLNLYSYGKDQMGGTASVRSWWQGKLSLQGRDWQLALVEGLMGAAGSGEGGTLVLRPWDERDQSVFSDDGSLRGFDFCHSLFFLDKTWLVDCAFVDGEKPGFNMSFTEQPLPVGEVNLSGQFIERLILTKQQGRPWFTVVLDTPGPKVRIPVGTYDRYDVYLKAKGQGASSTIKPGERSKPITVSATNAVELLVGGPLTNTVTVKSRGNSLALNYQLTGAGGAPYQLINQKGRTAPQFTIFNGDKQLASGSFEFG